MFEQRSQWSVRWNVRARRQRPGRLAARWPCRAVLALPFGGVAQAQSEDGLLVPSVPLMMVDAEAVTEGNSGEKAMVFPVAMSQPPLTPVRVVVATKDRTASGRQRLRCHDRRAPVRRGKPADPAGEGADQRRHDGRAGRKLSGWRSCA